MKLSELDPSEVQKAETTKLRLSDIDPSEIQKPIDLGPGSKDPSPDTSLAPAEMPAFSVNVGQIAEHPIESVKAVGRDTIEGFKGIGRSLLGANKQASDLIFHPSIIADPRFRNESMRGVNDTIMPYVGNRLVEEIGGPPKEDAGDTAAYPNARSLGQAGGMLVPLPIGESISLAANGMKSLAKGATEREIDRAALALGERTGKKARTKLEAKEGEPLRSVLRNEPEMMSASRKSDDVRTKAAESIIEKGHKELSQIYRESDIAAGRKPVATDIIQRAEALEGEAYATMDAAKQFPEGTPQYLEANRNAHTALSESRKLRREAAEKISTSRVHGIRVGDVDAGWDAKIAELKKSALQSDRSAAKALEDLRDGFKEHYSDPNQIIPSEELRRVQTDYQHVGFQKADPKDPLTSANIFAHQEASKIVGDPIIKHVTGMDYAEAKAFADANPNSVAGKLFAANERVSVGNNILASIKARTGQPEKPFLKKLAGKVLHGGVHAVPAAITHGASLPITLGIEALPKIPSAVDKALIAGGKLADKAPRFSTINPIGEATKGIRSLVDKMAEVQAKSPRNPELGAIVIDDYIKQDPKLEKYLKDRGKLEDAKRLANFAMDKSVDPEKRNAAIKEAMSLIEDFGNE